MPSAMIGNRTVQAASPDVGSAPASLGQISLAGQSEVLKQVLCVIEKKVRNMEKKKGKLDDYEAKKNKGERLNQDQLDALTKYQEIVNNLEFARELQKGFVTLGQDIQKAVKKTVRREQLQREEVEQKRLKNVLELQYLLDRLGDDSVRQELRQGVGGSPLLTDADLSALDEFYKLVGPDRDQNVRLADQYEDASTHLWDLMEGRDKAVVGTTYKALKESLDQVLQSGYFDKAPAHQNGVCEVRELPPTQQQQEEEEEEDEEEEEEVPAGAVVEPSEFVNRQFIPEGTYRNNDKEQAGDGTLSQTSYPLRLFQGAPLDPLVRKQVVQDLMEQMQGTYNFMQDSMLEFEGPPLDPAIVSAQPMKPPQIVDMPQMVCPPVRTESRLSAPNAVPVPSEPTQVPIVSPTPPPMYQTPHAQEPRPSTESLETLQSKSLEIQTSPLLTCKGASTALSPASQTQAFQPVSKAPHSSGINVNAAPFQSMQTVFNLNAPIPPASETEALNQASQYQNSYSQGFSSQAPLSAEASEMQSEQLQSEVGAFHSQDQSGGQQQQQASQQGAGFNRQGQSFYNSRGMARGGPRNARGMMNGYRGSSNGFRGGYNDNYRTPFPNTANSGYGQTQFNTPRDYPNGNYQRDGYQQNYKRGTGQGPRGAPRGGAQALRS
uniref:Cell cycle associated protein 1b n=1 Tax=Gadus morhua TaxID=8049 RepID=A0A8C5CJN3_GADMO